MNSLSWCTSFHLTRRTIFRPIDFDHVTADTFSSVKTTTIDLKLKHNVQNALNSRSNIFYSVSALLAMQTAVTATAFQLSVSLSVCPYARLSVTFQCFVKRNEDTIMPSSVSGSTIILVSGAVKITRTFAGDHPQRGR